MGTPIRVTIGPPKGRLVKCFHLDQRGLGPYYSPKGMNATGLGGWCQSENKRVNPSER